MDREADRRWTRRHPPHRVHDQAHHGDRRADALQEGRYLLDDPLPVSSRSSPQSKFSCARHQGLEVADLERPITHHLMTHTSGLTYPLYDNDPVSRLYHQAHVLRDDESLADNMRRIAALPLAHQPGTRWTYGVSLDVLGRLVEVIAGQSFDIFLQERIFAPLGMTDTGFYAAPENQDRVVPVYRSDSHGRLTREDIEGQVSQRPVFLSGGGGLLSTATDYARFCQMLIDGGVLGSVRLLGRKTVELMTASYWPSEKGAFPPEWLSPGWSASLGGGTIVDVAQSGLPCSVGTYSWGGAYSTGFWIDPHEQFFGLLMTHIVPFNPRLASLFQVLAYQALVA